MVKKSTLRVFWHMLPLWHDLRLAGITILALQFLFSWWSDIFGHLSRLLTVGHEPDLKAKLPCCTTVLLAASFDFTYGDFDCNLINCASLLWRSSNLFSWRISDPSIIITKVRKSHKTSFLLQLWKWSSVWHRTQIVSVFFLFCFLSPSMEHVFTHKEQQQTLERWKQEFHTSLSKSLY